jgi:hypothetical protein
LEATDWSERDVFPVAVGCAACIMGHLEHCVL